MRLLSFPPLNVDETQEAGFSPINVDGTPKVNFPYINIDATFFQLVEFVLHVHKNYSILSHVHLKSFGTIYHLLHKYFLKNYNFYTVLDYFVFISH